MPISMPSKQSQYIQDSMGLNLFFLRILKEHAAFLHLSFTPRDKQMANTAENFAKRIGELLKQTIQISKGYVPDSVMKSGELFTRYTEEAERKTQFFTGVPLDTSLTKEEYNLGGGAMPPENMKPTIDQLNRNALNIAQELLQFKERVLEDVLSCKTFTTNYPLMLDHISRENQHYIFMLKTLMSGDVELNPEEFAEEQSFWNMIMHEHAQFIEGLLDPSEEALKARAMAFANEFEMLEQRAENAQQMPQMLPEVTQQSEAATAEIRDFKSQGTSGILSCAIRSIIMPLLSDHVLREASHYLRVLQENK